MLFLALILSLAVIPSMAANPLVVWCETIKMKTIEPLSPSGADERRAGEG